jgi:serine/threonine protein phosphatase 1
MVLKKLFGKKTIDVNRAQAPDNTIIYAVGDIHGRRDLLEKLHDKILQDSLQSQSQNKIVVYMGDYIDRGRESKKTVDLLIENPLIDFQKIYIKGNHEIAMQSFIDSNGESAAWLIWGGDATLQSYGVPLRDASGQKLTNEQMAKMLAENIPDSHKEFYSKLKLCYISGDYIFVHAGLKPDVAIDQQKESDMTTIRDEFIFSSADFGKTVVFGHTVFSSPLNINGKIGVDTGAYASGILTAAVLEKNSVRFISTEF